MAAGNSNTPMYADQRLYDRDYCKELFSTRFRSQTYPPSQKTIAMAETCLSMKFGDKLREMLSRFGSLALAGFETLSLSDTKAERSALIRLTEALRAQTDKLSGCVVFAAQNDAFVTCCDESDRVFLYSRWDDSLVPLDVPLYTYIAGEGLLSEERVQQILANEE